MFGYGFRKRPGRFAFMELSLFLIGGCLYNIVELLFRGYTFPSMFLLGGICFLIIGIFNERWPWEMPLISQMFISMVVITSLELVFGLILNVVFNLGIWDYSNMPYNLFGQICLLFSVAWFFISLPAIIIEDWARYILFDEEVPRYTLFCAKVPPAESVDKTI